MPPSLSPRAGPAWLYAFLAVQVVAQTALIFPIGSGRTLFRVVTFASSLAMLGLVPAGGRPHPLRGLALGVTGVLVLGLLHPRLNSLPSGVGSVALNLAIWAPLFWVGRVRIDTPIFLRMMVVLWAFHTASSLAGVLQVYDPERFSPDAKFIEELLGDYAEGLKLTLDDGRRIYRPFGLTDSPGGAAGSGSYAAIVGMLLTTSRGVPGWLRAAAAASAATGMFCIYICQFRSILIVTTGGLLFLIALAAARGRTLQAVAQAGVLFGAAGGGFVWAASVGSTAVVSRLETLIERDVASTYQQNRGLFLEAALDDVPEYPLGAGLGRWGMMYNYFGDRNNPDAPSLWVEIQATGWLFDGGLPLLLLGYAAVVAACVQSVCIALRTPEGAMSNAAAVVAATNVTALLATFGYPYFISQGGMMFWVFNAALYAASVSRPKARPCRSPEVPS